MNGESPATNDGSAWAAELEVVKTVARAQLRARRGSAPSDDEVRRLATGILLLVVLDDHSLAVAEGFIDMEKDRRKGIDTVMSVPPAMSPGDRLILWIGILIALGVSVYAALYKFIS